MGFDLGGEAAGMKRGQAFIFWVKQAPGRLDPHVGLSWPSWRAKSGRPKHGLLGTGVPPDRTGHLDTKSRISLHPGLCCGLVTS